MSTKPILFSTPMVQAILDGRKTMTRRVIPELRGKDAWSVGRYKCLESPPGKVVMGEHFAFRYREDSGAFQNEYVPLRHRENDVLWVREAWCPCATINSWLDDVSLYGYKADYDKAVPWKWKPSIHMPREAARLFLRVTKVRVERVQDILCGDMQREGCIPKKVTGGQWQQWQHDYWIPLWDSLNAKRGYGWDTNPWVWVYSFERVDKPAGWPGGEGGE